MDFRVNEAPEHDIVFLDRAAVIELCREVQHLSVVAEALRAHHRGETILPAEAYLGWRTTGGAKARSLAMPGALGGSRQVTGLKVINSSLANVGHGLPRAQGMTMLFDRDTARPVAVMEAAYISALRTATVTAVTAQALFPAGIGTLALIGCGDIGRAHLYVLARAFAGLKQVRLFDHDPSRAVAAEAYLRELTVGAVNVEVVDDARSTMSDADLVVTATTVTQGYIGPGWLKPGALLAMVSLDDATPEAILAADVVLVDDWELVRGDDHRILGRMHRGGLINGPGTPTDGSSTRQVNATLGEVLTGARPGRLTPDDVVISNPFGMSLLDLAIADAVFSSAKERNLGLRLRL